MLTFPPTSTNNEYSFSILTPAEQNALLWQHNRWLLNQLTQAENTINVLQVEQTALLELANKNDFHRRFTADIQQHRDLTIQNLKRLKDLYRINPTIADLAVDELIDAVKGMGRRLQVEAKQRLDITD